MTNHNRLSSYKLSSAQPQSPKAGPASLPGQYIRALFQPTPSTYALEAERASWGMVWFQLLILILIPLLLGLVRGLDHSLSSQVATRSRVLSDILVAFSFGASVAALVLRTIIAPIFFFITVVIQFLLAKIFRGAGSFLQQSYATLLYQVPLAILGAILSAIIVFVQRVDLHVFNPVISIVLFVYGIVLNVTMLKGVHRLPGHQATLVVIFYYVVLFLIVVGLLVLLASLIISAIHNLVR